MIKNNRIINDFKVLKANRKNLREFAKEKYIDESGIANIDLYVNNNDLYNKLSNPNNPLVSDDIISYIENEAYHIPVEYPIRVNIYSDDKIDIEKFKKALNEHYWKKLACKNDDLKHNRIISTILLIVGIIFLSLYFYFEFANGVNVVFTELFSITGSFAIWEAIDYSFLNRGALNIERLNITQLALIDIIQK